MQRAQSWEKADGNLEGRAAMQTWRNGLIGTSGSSTMEIAKSCIWEGTTQGRWTKALVCMLAACQLKAALREVLCSLGGYKSTKSLRSALVAKKAYGILAGISYGVTSRSRWAILPLSFGESSPEMLRSVQGSLVKKRHGAPEQCLTSVYCDGEIGAFLLWAIENCSAYRRERTDLIHMYVWWENAKRTELGLSRWCPVPG